jgi:hypothetical protein
MQNSDPVDNQELRKDYISHAYRHPGMTNSAIFAVKVQRTAALSELAKKRINSFPARKSRANGKRATHLVVIL